MKTVPYTPEYREDLRRICIETASPDNKVNPEHHDFTLMMYCDPYIDHETAFMLMDSRRLVFPCAFLPVSRFNPSHRSMEHSE